MSVDCGTAEGVRAIGRGGGRRVRTGRARSVRRRRRRPRASSNACRGSSTARRPTPIREPIGSSPLTNRFHSSAATEPFSITYTHQGQTLTLDDYFRRTDVLGFLVLKDGRTVFERYLHGTGPSDRYLSMSVSKSVVSVLVGVAVDEGRIASVNDPVVKYVPRLKSSGYRDATIKDVLHMATGVQFSEEYGSAASGIGQLSAASRTGSPTFEEFAASLPSEQPPGTKFNYQSINTQVLALVLEKATGVPLNIIRRSRSCGRRSARRATRISSPASRNQVFARTAVSTPRCATTRDSA